MLGVSLLILSIMVLLIIVLIWFINRPVPSQTSVAAITAMIFEDDCRTYMDPSSGVVAIDPSCKCCAHHRGEK